MMAGEMVPGGPAVDLVVVLGPTASGKTRLGVALARLFDGEILSADSRQVYRGMDIGTGKDLDEYGETPLHLVDIVDPGGDFSVFEFQRRFRQACTEIADRGKMPFLVGGSGLYLDAALNNYHLAEVPENPPLRGELASLPLAELTRRLQDLNPRLHNSTDILDRDRLIRAIEIAVAAANAPYPDLSPPFSPLVFGIRWERSLLRERITRRLKERLSHGMIEEVERLHAAGVPYETLDYYGLEYRFVAKYLQGELNRNDLFQKLNSAIHDFAKRQETWFRRMERNGTAIHWLDGAGDPLAAALRIMHHGG